MNDRRGIEPGKVSTRRRPSGFTMGFLSSPHLGGDDPGAPPRKILREFRSEELFKEGQFSKPRDWR